MLWVCVNCQSHCMPLHHHHYSTLPPSHPTLVECSSPPLWEVEHGFTQCDPWVVCSILGQGPAMEAHVVATLPSHLPHQCPYGSESFRITYITVLHMPTVSTISRPRLIVVDSVYRLQTAIPMRMDKLPRLPPSPPAPNLGRGGGLFSVEGRGRGADMPWLVMDMLSSNFDKASETLFKSSCTLFTLESTLSTFSFTCAEVYGQCAKMTECEMPNGGTR